jgi:hypothetical protein
MDTLSRKYHPLFLDYEWHYYIGGNCSLKHRKTREQIALIHHVELGIYEALINRKQGQNKSLQKSSYISVGIFNDSNEAQAVINQILEEKFDESTSAVCRMD